MFKCEYCTSIFTRIDSLTRHYKICKIKSNKNKNKNKGDINDNNSSVYNKNINEIEHTFMCNRCNLNCKTELILSEHTKGCTNGPGVIYLIQPAELLNTCRYKIGCSKNSNLDRCKNGYKSGSRYICIMECHNPLFLENNIKKCFSKHFKLIAGNEYFEGNEENILNLFINEIIKHRNAVINNTNNNYLMKPVIQCISKTCFKSTKNSLDNSYNCKFCGMIFTRGNNLTRHLRICSSANNEIIRLKNENDQYKEMNEYIREENNYHKQLLDDVREL